MFDVNSMYTLYRDFLRFSRHSDACNLLKFYTKMYMLYNIIIAPKVLTIVLFYLYEYSKGTQVALVIMVNYF